MLFILELVLIRFYCTVSIVYHLNTRFYTVSSKLAKNFFHRNDSALKIVESQIHQFFSKKIETTVCEPNEKQTFFSTPYFSTQPDRLAKVLSALISEFIPHYVFVLVQVNCHKMGIYGPRRIGCKARYFLFCYIGSVLHDVHPSTWV